ncbi:hypothetical protein JXB27_02945 [Candidatus Woesearchaeota archaeon]|nr:hypothetical protein [Candidatus Woesearchaeota archaeon]
MTPLDRVSEEIRESTLKAYSLAESMGLNPSNISQTYRPVDSGKQIATGVMELSVDDFRKVQTLLNDYLTRGNGFNISFSPFFDGCRNVTIDRYLEIFRKQRSVRPKRIMVKINDKHLTNPDGNFVIKDELEFKVTEVPKYDIQADANALPEVQDTPRVTEKDLSKKILELMRD